ncbi:uncharacterized protein O3C94_017701 isoform 1-T1 [Discoglossus pictus]
MSLSREMSLPIILALALAGCFAAENSRDDQMRVISFMQDESSPLSGDTNNYETESTFFNDFIDSNPYSTSPELNGPVEEFLRLMFPKMMNCSANEVCYEHKQCLQINETDICLFLFIDAPHKDDGPDDFLSKSADFPDDKDFEDFNDHQNENFVPDPVMYK